MPCTRYVAQTRIIRTFSIVSVSCHGLEDTSALDGDRRVTDGGYTHTLQYFTFVDPYPSALTGRRVGSCARRTRAGQAGRVNYIQNFSTEKEPGVLVQNISVRGNIWEDLKMNPASNSSNQSSPRFKRNLSKNIKELLDQTKVALAEDGSRFGLIQHVLTLRDSTRAILVKLHKSRKCLTHFKIVFSKSFLSLPVDP